MLHRSLLGLGFAMLGSTKGFSTPVAMQRHQQARSSVVRCAELDAYDSNDLVIAARKGKIGLLVEALSQTTNVDMAVTCSKIPTMEGASALVWAARQGQLEAVTILLENNANVNIATASGWTALYAAALNGHDQIVDLLLTRGASVADALSLGDERTNINLNRMVRASKQEKDELPATAPATEVATISDSDSDWKAALKGTATQPNAATKASASALAEFGLGGMNELETLRLRLAWKAPPTVEEQRAADAARQTLFKYRHQQIEKIEAQMAAGGASGRPAAAAPVAPLVAPAAAAPFAGSPLPSPPAAPAAVSSGVISRLETVEMATLTARLEAVEASLAELSSGKTIDPSGFADAYAAGFSAGFAAGRAAN